MKEKKVIVFSEVHNIWDMMLVCIKSVKKCSPELDFYLMDNGSTTPMPSEVAPLIAGSVRCDTFLGTSKAYNMAFRMIQGVGAEIAILLGSDTEVTSCRWIEHLLAPFSDPSTALVGYEVYTFLEDGTFVNSPVGNYYSWIEPWCLAFRKRLLDEIGVFDEQFYPFGFDDVDWQLRIKRKGYHLCIIHPADVIHKRSQTTSKYVKYDLIEAMRMNRLRLFKKWGKSVVVTRENPCQCHFLNLEGD